MFSVSGSRPLTEIVIPSKEECKQSRNLCRSKPTQYRVRRVERILTSLPKNQLQLPHSTHSSVTARPWNRRTSSESLQTSQVNWGFLVTWLARCQGWGLNPGILAPESVAVTASEQIQTNHPLIPILIRITEIEGNHLLPCLQVKDDLLFCPANSCWAPNMYQAVC